eukprot:NODE_29281_length_450_cov_6.919505.p4 GENE.NODE_29281_length_450_cov_6.919505~~NODE_29281_length_450_cov_6.919505.p4  ORF type:complete len:58 (+),score=15.77 NODE_29281_length_450_cov_6.919505:62-235(+)
MPQQSASLHDGHNPARQNGHLQKQPFTRLEFVYCTTDCVRAHQRQLQADAAAKRFAA